jgi:hypothetical protein
LEQSVKQILSTIDDAIAKFQDAIPGIQKLIYDELQPLLKKIDIKDGKLLNNVNNLKLIGELKNKLEKIIINPEYKKSVEKFIESFGVVANLQQDYFSQFNQKYKAKNTLPIIKQLAVESTITDLVGQGMSSNVIDPIQRILTQNITTGGNYANFQNQLRNHILNNETGDGSLERYTKQITTDAIHQYNATYHDTIAQDLQFNWCRYVGSNLTTSREFCILMTKKQWAHKTELPDIIKGHIGDTECKLSKTTGLPLGMIPGTNVDNFKVRRGGYNCGHQAFWVPDSAVPEEVKAKFAGGKVPAKEEPAMPTKKALKNDILQNNKESIKKISDDKIAIYDDLFDNLIETIVIKKTNKAEAYCTTDGKTVVIGNYNRDRKSKGFIYKNRNLSDYFRDTVMAHETGHAIHVQKEVIILPQKANNIEAKVSEGFASHFDNLKSIIKGKEKSVEDFLIKTRSGSNQDEKEQIGVLADILGSLTKGKYGWGHELKYYNRVGYSEAEIFAHSISLLKVDNKFANSNAEMKQVIEEMKTKILDWL